MPVARPDLMLRMGLAVFADRTGAHSARSELQGRAGSDRVRVHEGGIDPLLGADLRATRAQRIRDRRLGWRCFGAVALGLLAGFAAAQVTGSDGAGMASAFRTAAWTAIGGLVGFCIAAALSLGEPPRHQDRALKVADDALLRGQTVLTVRFPEGAQQLVADLLRGHGGRFLRLA